MTSTFAFTGRTRTGSPVSGERTAESVTPLWRHFVASRFS